VRITTGRLVKHPCRPKDCARRALMAGSIAKQSGFDVVGAEDPLDPRLLVENQSPNEVPVAPVVELECATPGYGPPKAVEAQPTVVRCGKASRVFDEEQDVRIPPRSMTPVTRVCPAGGSGQIADVKRIPTWERLCHLCRRMLDRPDERNAPISRLFARSKTSVARTLVGAGRRIAEVPAIRGSDGDRLAPLQWLSHARADRDERQ